MIRRDVSYSDTGYFSQLILDYLAADPSLGSLYGLSPAISSFKQKIKERQHCPIDRNTLVNVLSRQYSSIDNSNALENIKLLGDDKTFTVCTGHQICIFTGPLYFIYKIASAIVLARQLKIEYPEFNFVPVYWMATEDHDYEEINHINFRGRRIAWNKSTQGFVGDLPVDGLSDIIAELKNKFGASNFAAELIEKLESAYARGGDLASATRIFVDSLFEEHGLVIIDANDKHLKGLFVEEMESEIVQQNALKHTADAIAILEKKYKVQVNPRPINLFYLKDDKRVRIDYDAGKYFILADNKEEVTLDWLRSELKDNPQKFSPNVLMRPMYQEKILPNLAYIGGGGELAYWFELKRLFDEANVSFPILFLRNSFLLIDEKSSALISKMEIEDSAIFNSKDELIKNLLQKLNSGWSPEDNEKLLTKAYESIAEDISNIDITLESSAKGELKRCLNRLKHLDQKVNRALKRQNDTQVLRIDKIKSNLFPNGSLQERHENLLEHYLVNGPQLVDQIIENTDLFNFNFGLLRY